MPIVTGHLGVTLMSLHGEQVHLNVPHGTETAVILKIVRYLFGKQTDVLNLRSVSQDFEEKGYTCDVGDVMVTSSYTSTELYFPHNLFATATDYDSDGAETMAPDTMVVLPAVFAMVELYSVYRPGSVSVRKPDGSKLGKKDKIQSGCVLTVSCGLKTLAF